MYELLKKRVQKRTITRIIIALVVIVVCMVGTDFAIFQVVKGPITLTPDMDYSEYEGKYVTYNARCILSEYVRIEETNTTTKKSKLLDIGYFVFDEENGSFLGIQLDAKNESKMDQLIDESLDYFFQYTDIQPDGIKVTGTLTKLEEEDLEFYNENLDYIFSEIPEYKQYAIPYTIIDGTIGGTETIMFYLFTAASIIAVLYIIYAIFSLFSDKYKKKLNQFLNDHPSVSSHTIEDDFSSATKFGKDIWVGKHWTIFISGVQSQILTNKDLVWAYYYYTRGRHAESLVRIFTKDKSSVDIHVSKKIAMQILDHYSTTQSHMVIGYDKDLESLFNAEFDEFLEIKYNAAIAATEDEF